MIHPSGAVLSDAVQFVSHRASYFELKVWVRRKKTVFNREAGEQEGHLIKHRCIRSVLMLCQSDKAVLVV